MATAAATAAFSLTFEVLPGDGGFRAADGEAEEVHVAPLVHRNVLRDVHDPGGN